MTSNGDSEKTKPSKRKPKKAKPWYRSAVQIFFFVLVAAITINKALIENGTGLAFFSKASLHAICPFGGVVSIYEFVTSGQYTQKTHASSFILMYAGFGLAVGFGPLICGWVCPFGSFQQWTGKLGKKLHGKKYNHLLPVRLDSYLRYTRYLVLALVVYATAVTGKLVFQDYDPYFALFNFWSEEVAPTALIILGATLVGSLFVERPWCKYLCPYGAVLGLSNLFRIFKIRREVSTCINCKLCDRNCPMNITISTAQAVRDHQCISCLNCTSEQFCPVADTVDFTTKRPGPVNPAEIPAEEASI